MKKIEKGREPRSLTYWRANNPGVIDWSALDSSVKVEIRKLLCVEQHGLCAYCQSRIRSDDCLTIEHFQPRSEDPSATFKWNNLLGVCLDGKGTLTKEIFCEKARGNRPLHVNPADDDYEQRNKFKYNSKGEIRGLNDHAESDIETLRLNSYILKKNRLKVRERLTKELPTAASSSELRKELQKWRCPNRKGNLREYAGCAEYFLERWISKRSR